MIENKTIFITGGAGFIGSNLVERLAPKNKIIVYDHILHDYFINYVYPEYKDNIVIVKADILNYDALESTILDADPDFIIHCAAVIGITTVTINTVHTIDTILIGTHNILKASLKLKNLKLLINFSTSEVCGQLAYLSHESDTTHIGSVGEKRWTYAASKLVAEHLAIAYYQQYRLPTTNIRPYNVYGPGQANEGAMFFFVNNIFKNKNIEIHGDGNQVRSWCYIDDFIDGVMSMLKDPQKTYGYSFNLGNPREIVTIYNLASYILTNHGKKSEIQFVKAPGKDIYLRIPSIDRAKEKLNFNPKINLKEGIEKYFNFLKNHANI